jgi:hypothetical protein
MAAPKKECPSCAMNIAAKEVVCPVCGYEFPQTSGGMRWLAILLLVVLLFYLAFNLWGS